MILVNQVGRMPRREEEERLADAPRRLREIANSGEPRHRLEAVRSIKKSVCTWHGSDRSWKLHGSAASRPLLCTWLHHESAILMVGTVESHF